MHFSEIIQLEFGKKLPYILCILTPFLKLWLLSYLSKMHGYPHFSFRIPIALAKIYFFTIVITFSKIRLSNYLGGTVIKRSEDD